jgi:hypothetical protein
MEELESKIEGECVDIAEWAGWKGYKIALSSTNGWPDRCFMRRGRCVYFEFKRRNEPAKPQQILRACDIAQSGFEVYFVANVDYFRRVLAAPITFYSPTRLRDPSLYKYDDMENFAQTSLRAQCRYVK